MAPGSERVIAAIVALGTSAVARAEPPANPPARQLVVGFGFGPGGLSGVDGQDTSRAAAWTIQFGIPLTCGLRLLIVDDATHFTYDARHPDQVQDHDAYSLAVQWTSRRPATTRAPGFMLRLRAGGGIAHLTRSSHGFGGDTLHTEWGPSVGVGAGVLSLAGRAAWGLEVVDNLAFHDAGLRHAFALLFVFDVALFGGTL